MRIGLSVAKLALWGIGLWKLSTLAISYSDLLRILNNKNPQIARSLTDAVENDPEHLGRILTGLNPPTMTYEAASAVTDQVCYAVSKGKGKPHQLLIQLLDKHYNNKT